MKYNKEFKATELHYILALLEHTNLTFKLGINLFELFPNIEELFSLSTDELVKLGLQASEANKLKKPNWDLIAQDLRWAEKPGNRILTIKDQDYPPLLKEISDPPLLLFVSGDLQLLQLPQIAIVGSRNPTFAGLETAFAFAKELAQAGLVITSGFAAGIDAAAHKGAIAVSGKTIAVMGTGLNRIYPSHHKFLAQKILDAGGVLLSEFPLNAAGKAWHFPVRNRIISGLSFGALVVEATVRSGSLITARLASEQGREVFAVPGSINNPLARGCHYLIQQGAKLVEQPSDILEELKDLSGITKAALAQISPTKTSAEKNKLDREHKKLLDCMGYETTAIDVLVTRSGWSISKVSAMLLELELKGLIKMTAYGYVVC